MTKRMEIAPENMRNVTDYPTQGPGSVEEEDGEGDQADHDDERAEGEG